MFSLQNMWDLLGFYVYSNVDFLPLPHHAKPSPLPVYEFIEPSVLDPWMKKVHLQWVLVPHVVSNCYNHNDKKNHRKYDKQMQ